MVRNLRFPQKYASWSHFLTYTCNEKTHVGTSPIKNWIYSGYWKINYPTFYYLRLDEQKEINEAVTHSSAGVLILFWE